MPAGGRPRRVRDRRSAPVPRRRARPRRARVRRPRSWFSPPLVDARETARGRERGRSPVARRARSRRPRPRSAPAAARPRATRRRRRPRERAGGCAPPPRRARSRARRPSARVARPPGPRRTPRAPARARARPAGPARGGGRARARAPRPARPSSTSAPLKRPGQSAPAARAPVAVHALDERDRPPRAGDVERERRVVAHREAAVERAAPDRRAGSPARADPRHRRQDGARRRRQGRRAPVDEAALTPARLRTPAVSGSGASGRVGPERLARPDGRIGHDRVEPALGWTSAATSLPPRERNRRSARVLGRDHVGPQHHNRQPRVEVEVSRSIAQADDVVARARSRLAYAAAPYGP